MGKKKSKSKKKVCYATKSLMALANSADALHTVESNTTDTPVTTFQVGTNVEVLMMPGRYCGNWEQVVLFDNNRGRYRDKLEYACFQEAKSEPKSFMVKPSDLKKVYCLHGTEPDDLWGEC
jgi:hypothetical protein